MEDKIEYIKYILLSCIEGNGLFDFYIYEVKKNKIEYEYLKKIFIYWKKIFWLFTTKISVQN